MDVEKEIRSKPTSMTPIGYDDKNTNWIVFLPLAIVIVGILIIIFLYR